MNKSLLFIPDISGFTNFVQTTEIEHSQHVIAELLEILISANSNEFQLAEIEGDALFFYHEGELPSLESLLAKVETIFTAFYSHLKLLEKNRICPCNACKTAPNLDLKIIAHSGELQFISVQDKRKPFGVKVIEVHRLMKNSVDSDNYFLLSKELSNDIELPDHYQSKLFDFVEGMDEYDGKEIDYIYSTLDKKDLSLKPFKQAKKVKFDKSPPLTAEREFPTSAPQLFEYITNYVYRTQLVVGAHKFEYNEHEISRVGSKHACVIDGKDIDFITVTKDGEPGQLIYGELSSDVPFVKEFYKFSVLSPLTNDSCKLKSELYWKTKSVLHRLVISLFAKRFIKKKMHEEMDKILKLVKKENARKLDEVAVN